MNTPTAAASRTADYIRPDHVIEKGLAPNRTTLMRWVKKGLFPAPVALGPNTLAFRASDILDHENRLRDAAAARFAGKAA